MTRTGSWTKTAFKMKENQGDVKNEVQPPMMVTLGSGHKRQTVS